VYKLITAEDIRQFTKGTDSISADFNYALADIIIPAVGALFAKYCNRPDFDKIARTEYLSPRYGRTKIFLASPPVAAAQVGPPVIEALRLYEDTAAPRVYGASTELISGTDFFVFEDQGVIERFGCFVGGPKTIKVTYTGGYLTNDAEGCPEELRLAAIMQSKIFFDRREEYGVTGRSLEGGSFSMLNILTLPRQVTGLLDAYKIFGWD
jgi:hypothetical protein